MKPVTNRALGIDISHWHPLSTATMAKVFESKVRFIGVKATDGLSQDPTFKGHRRLCTTAGHQLALAIYYHFVRPGSPIAQADRLAAAVGQLSPRERLCLDLEGTMPETTASKTLAWVDAFFDRLDVLYPNRQPLLYTSANVWEGIGNPAWARAARVPLWAPRYNQAMAEPRMPRPWQGLGWHFWQWSDGDTPSFSIPGVDKFDANYFRSDETALRAWVEATSGSPTAVVS